MSKVVKKKFISILIFFMVVASSPQYGALAKEHEPHLVRISHMEMLVMAGEDKLTIFQTIQYRNNGKENVPFFINLPEIYENAVIIGGLPKSTEIEYKENGILIDSNLPIGDTSIIISYYLPMEQRHVTPIIEQPFLTDRIDILIPIKRLTVTANGFLPHSSRETFGQNDFRRFNRLNLQPKEQWPILLRQYRGETVGKDPFLIAGEPIDPSIKVIGNVHEKNIPKSIINILLIVFILTIGMISIHRSTRR